MHSSHPANRTNDHGFTFLETVMAMVVVGILSAVGQAGIDSLTTTAGRSACPAYRRAAAAAAVMHHTATGSYPSTLSAMTTSTPIELMLPIGVIVDPMNETRTKGARWSLALTAGGGAVEPTFTCM